MAKLIDFNFHKPNNIVLMDVMVDGDYIVTARLANGEFELPLHNQHLNSQVLSNTLSLGTAIYNRDATIAEKINGKDIVVNIKTKYVDMAKVVR